jgi:cation diffusion facilitator family transporter
MLTLPKKKVAWLSVVSNSALVIGKIAAGILTGSVSVLSEAAHSGVDLLAAAIATFSVHVSDRAPDQDHPYGHEKIENVSGVIEGILIFAAAGWIIYESVHKLIHPSPLPPLGPAIMVMALSAVINLIVAAMLQRTARAERSIALEADASHLYTDVYTSAGVLLGLAVISGGQRFFQVQLYWLDPVIAIGVAVLILHTAGRITRKSFRPLMDAAASPEEEAAIKRVMAEFERQGVDIHKLRTRRAGPSLHVDLHMGCRPGLSLERGHAVSHELKSRIEETVPGARVLVHVEPTAQARELGPKEARYTCIKEELLRDPRVCQVRDLVVTEYREELRVEAKLGIVSRVTLSESRACTQELETRVRRCVPQVKELELSIFPADGWRDAIHEDDMDRIRELVGEHESVFAGIHELKVSSTAGRHRVRLRLAVPRLLPVADGHDIGLHIKDDITRLFPDDVEVDVIIEPCAQTCESCRAACPERPGQS